MTTQLQLINIIIIIIIIIINCMGSPSWMVGNLGDDDQKIPHLLWNAMVHCNMIGPALRH